MATLPPTFPKSEVSWHTHIYLFTTKEAHEADVDRKVFRAIMDPTLTGRGGREFGQFNPVNRPPVSRSVTNAWILHGVLYTSHTAEQRRWGQQCMVHYAARQ